VTAKLAGHGEAESRTENTLFRKLLKYKTVLATHENTRGSKPWGIQMIIAFQFTYHFAIERKTNQQT